MKTETMVVESLYNVFTKRNFRVVIATPYETQTEMIFKRLNELISSSPLLKNQVISNTKHPFRIMLNNESGILGFTAGNDGSGLRGQRCDLLVLDEVDYINEPSYNAITAITAERNDIRTIMSSTPTGKRSHFYMACTNPDLG